MRYLAACVVLFTSLVLHEGAAAQMLGRDVAKWNPFAGLTDEDMAVLNRTARELLDRGNVGDRRAWRNDTTGHGGTLTIIEPLVALDERCREVRYDRNDTSRTYGTLVFHVCRQADGTWRTEN